MTDKQELAESYAFDRSRRGVMPIRSHIIAAGGRSLHVRRWAGDPAKTVVIWHGITGTGLDHVELAERLSESGFQILAPDSIGCGGSDWAREDEAATGYGLAALCDVATGMLDHFALERVCWLGLSKGGGLGIRLAATAPDRIAALILCDVGPSLPDMFRTTLAQRLASPPRSDSLSAFRAQVTRMLARSGVEGKDALVDRLSAAWSRRLDDGGIAYHYDPALSQQLIHRPEDFDLWPFWDGVVCPALILKGEHSDVLPATDLNAMLARNEAARSDVLKGAGHITFLDDPAHQEMVIRFFESVL